MLDQSIARALASIAIVGLIAVGCAGGVAVDDGADQDGRASPVPAVAFSDAAIPYEGVVMAPPIDLVRPDGSTFEVADALGSPLLVFFGYTHCPDVCPATLGTLINVLEARPDIRIAYITVDPERDTREWLAGWMEYFPPQFTGLTGTPAQIRTTADAYGARYARGEETENGYLMVHSADVYLIDDAGRLLARYPFGTEAESIVDDLARAVPTQDISAVDLAAG